MKPDKIMSSSVSLEEQGPSVSISQEKSPSGKRPRHRRKAASITQIGPDSSPPIQSGLKPDQSQVRRSSIQLPTQNDGTPPNTDSIYPEAHEEMDFEIDTPTRKPTRRARPKSSVLNKYGGSSPLRQTVTPEIDVGPDQDEIITARPPIGLSHTSPEIPGRAGRKIQRPNVTERSASDPVTPAKKLSGFQLDDDIAQLIKDGPKRDKGKEKENGSIYFYKVKPRGSEVWLLKIGRTQKHAKERLGQIKGVCGHLEIEEHTKAVARDIPFHGFAEKLIHTELGNYQYQWLCDCGTRHREYFQVSEDLAVKVFERWRDFCQEMPWDHDGKILPKWAQRLQNRAKFNGKERDFDHHEFARRWTAFTAPMSLERFLSDAICVWRLGFPNRWLIVSLAELLTIVCISRHSFWTSMWTTIIVLLLLLDLVVTENMHTTASIFQLMEGGLQSVSLQPKMPEDTKEAEAESPAPRSSPDNGLRQRYSGEARGVSAAASSQSPVDIRQAMDSDDAEDRWGIMDDEDDLDAGPRSPVSLDADLPKKEVFNRRKSQNLCLEEGPD